MAFCTLASQRLMIHTSTTTYKPRLIKQEDSPKAHKGAKLVNPNTAQSQIVTTTAGSIRVQYNLQNLVY